MITNYRAAWRRMLDPWQRLQKRGGEILERLSNEPGVDALALSFDRLCAEHRGQDRTKQALELLRGLRAPIRRLRRAERNWAATVADVEHWRARTGLDPGAPARSVRQALKGDDDSARPDVAARLHALASRLDAQRELLAAFDKPDPYSGYAAEQLRAHGLPLYHAIAGSPVMLAIPTVEGSRVCLSLDTPWDFDGPALVTALLEHLHASEPQRVGMLHIRAEAQGWSSISLMGEDDVEPFLARRADIQRLLPKIRRMLLEGVTIRPPDQETHPTGDRISALALVVFDPDGEWIGDASATRLGDDVAEVTHGVDAKWRHVGVGWRLLAELVGRCREAGLARLIAPEATYDDAGLAQLRRLGAKPELIEGERVLAVDLPSIPTELLAPSHL